MTNANLVIQVKELPIIQEIIINGIKAKNIVSLKEQMVLEKSI